MGFLTADLDALVHLPGHGVGGGGFGDGEQQGRPIAPEPDNAGTINTKGELPDLPSDSSPLQFGDWLHLIAPVMKDISGVAGWWWETTAREASSTDLDRAPTAGCPQRTSVPAHRTKRDSDVAEGHS